MPRQVTKQPRKVVIRAQKDRSGTRYDVYTQLAVLLAAAGVENTSVGLREDKAGDGVTVKLWCPDDPVECWLDLYNDLEGQCVMLIREVWGNDTLAQARATMAPWGPEQAVEPSESPRQGRRSGKGGDGA